MVQEYFLGVFGQVLSPAATTPAVAPAPNVKFALFADPLALCDGLGLLAGTAAAQYRGLPPGNGGSGGSSGSRDPGAARRLRVAATAVPGLVAAVLLAALALRWRDRPWVDAARRLRRACSGDSGSDGRGDFARLSTTEPPGGGFGGASSLSVADADAKAGGFAAFSWPQKSSGLAEGGSAAGTGMSKGPLPYGAM